MKRTTVKKFTHKNAFSLYNAYISRSTLTHTCSDCTFSLHIYTYRFALTPTYFTLHLTVYIYTYTHTLIYTNTSKIEGKRSNLPTNTNTPVFTQ